METVRMLSLMERLASKETWRNMEKDVFDEDFLFESDESRIRRIFGKITVPKERWHEVDDANEKDEKKIVKLPRKFKPKFFSVNSYRIKGLSSSTVLGIFSGMESVRLDQVIRLLHTVTGKKFSVWKFSNLRMILKPVPAESNSSFLEIRYDKKLFMNSVSHQEDAEAPEIATTKPSNKKDSHEFTSDEKRTAREIGKEQDTTEIKAKIAFVKKHIGNAYDPIKKDKLDKAKVLKDSGVSKNVVVESGKASHTLFSIMSKLEPAITVDVVNAVSSFGGQMFGLDYRLKQPTSLATKIAIDSQEFTENHTVKNAIKKAAANVKDCIRYTAVFPTNRLADGYKQTKRLLSVKGYKEIRCKNFYLSYEKGESQQKAIQSVFSAPDGTLFEFQFHTINSLGIKEINHVLYKEYGSDSTTDEQKRILDLRMRYLSANVETPPDVLKIKSWG